MPSVVQKAEPLASLPHQMVAEMFGTFLLVFLGCGSVHAAVLTGAQQGVWQVAVVWGIAIMLAIYSIGGVSGAHINPAITCAFALWRDFPRSRVLPFILAQLTGAFIAAAALYFIFNPQLSLKEHLKGVVRGDPGSEITAMCYGEYFPNPASLAAGTEPYSSAEHIRIRGLVPHSIAFVAELLGTAVLGFVVFAVTDVRNPGRPMHGQAPILIGLTVSGLISVIGPLTQAGFNPARDFGPRLFAAFAGWGRVALPGSIGIGWLTVYILAPILGAALGAGLYQFAIRPGKELIEPGAAA